MNDKSKSDNIESFSSISSETKNTDNPLSISYGDEKERKNEGCNDWNSVPKTYDKEESCREHKKTATNNQWCSCNK
jgi:transglutaminase/protease-like cytokinesis protein 3